MVSLDTSRKDFRLRLIGAFDLSGQAGSPVTIRSRRGRGLLAYLHLAPGREAARGRLCSLLWSDRGEPQARASLRQGLVELRDVFAAADLPGLEAARETIGWADGQIASDVSLLRAALTADDSDALTEALTLIGNGRLLEDLEIGGAFQVWLREERARLDHAITAGVQAHLSRLEDLGAWEQVRRLAEAFLQRSPLDEVVAAAAIRGDAATGNTSAAYRRFEILQVALSQDLGAPPIAEPERTAIAEVTHWVGPPLVVVGVFSSNPPMGDMANSARTLREEVVSGLSRFHDLRVITDPRGLDVMGTKGSVEFSGDYALGANLRAAAQGANMVVHLVRLGDRQIVWAGRFEVSSLDVVETIDNIISQVVGAVVPTIDADLLRRPSHLPTDPIYQRYVAAREAATAARTFAQATAAKLELEALVAEVPTFALPYLPLAALYNTDFRFTLAGSSGPTERARALQLTRRALTFDREHANSYTQVAFSHLYKAQWELARENFDQALKLNPFHALRVNEVGFGMVFLGELDTAQKLLDRCLLLNPSPRDDFFVDLGLLALMRGAPDRAVNYFELVADPGIWALVYGAIAAQMTGGEVDEKAALVRSRIAEIWPRRTEMDLEAMVAWIASHHPFRHEAHAGYFLLGARRMLGQG